MFVSGFLFFMALFYIFWQSGFYNNYIHPIIIKWNSFLSSLILNLFGQNTTSEFGIIHSPQVSISISRGCDAIEAMALFVSMTLAFPMKWKNKLIGIAFGIALLFIINLIRIVSLFFSMLYQPKIFDVLHAQFWPVLIIIISTILWLIIMRTQKRKVEEVKK